MMMITAGNHIIQIHSMNEKSTNFSPVLVQPAEQERRFETCSRQRSTHSIEPVSNASTRLIRGHPSNISIEKHNIECDSSGINFFETMNH